MNSQLAQSSDEAQIDADHANASEEFALLNRYWDAANYLTVAQIYLQENALLTSPLTAEHIKPRLLGHWGTIPGLSLIYVHLNRLIRNTGAKVLLVAGVRENPGRFHVRGYSEHGTTTTPFDMVVLNKMSRYHLALEALHRVSGHFVGTQELAEHCREMLSNHDKYIREHLEDMPEIREWVWTPPTESRDAS